MTNTKQPDFSEHYWLKNYESAYLPKVQDLELEKELTKIQIEMLSAKLKLQERHCIEMAALYEKQKAILLNALHLRWLQISAFLDSIVLSEEETSIAFTILGGDLSRWTVNALSQEQAIKAISWYRRHNPDSTENDPEAIVSAIKKELQSQ